MELDTFVLRYQDVYVLNHKVVPGVCSYIETTPYKQLGEQFTYEGANSLRKELGYELGMHMEIEPTTVERNTNDTHYD